MKLWRILTVLFALVAAPLAHAQNPGSASPAVRLYVLEGGVLASDPTRYRLTPAEVQSVPLSVAAYLIVHPRGILLWDANAIADGERISQEGGVEQRVLRADGAERFVTLGPTFDSLIRSTGHTPADVTHLALSHYHWDHTANANAFAHATWLVRKVERDIMLGAEAPGGARPATYTALKNSKTAIITAEEHDVFGDGTVIIKHAPGHSEGHQLLYVKLAKTGGIVLSGDLYHYPEERSLNRLPTFDVSEEQTRDSRAELERFLERQSATLWIQHDLVNHRKLKKAPEYYE